MRTKKVKQTSTQRPRVAGFGLVETLLFVFIVGATLIAGYMWLSATKEVERVQTQITVLQQANRAIEGFATANFRLPCPASVPGGFEDCAGGRQKGYVPAKTLGLDGAAEGADLARMGYMVNRGTASDLAAASNTFEPRKWNGALHAFNQTSTADYCRNLLLANGNASGAAVINGGVAQPVAYAIAHPGAVDANGDGDMFDGFNGGTAAQMESPDRKPARGQYDDQVLARTAGDLAVNSNCDTIIASLNIIALGADVMDEVNSAKIVVTATASVMAAIGIAKTAAGVYKVVKAIILLAGSGATLSASVSLLAGAIGTCVVLVGCAAIPHAAASVAVSVLSIAAAVLAVAGATAAVIANLVYIGLVLEVAVLAGISTNQNVDLTLVIASALTAWQDAIAQRIAAATILTNAQNAATSTFNAQNGAHNNLYAEARSIVAATNAAGVPAGTTPTTDLDIWVADTVSRIGGLNQARFILVGARNELAIALGTLPLDNGVIANKQALVDNAMVVEAAALSDYNASRQNLIDRTRRRYCVTTTTTTTSGSTTTTTTTTDCDLFFDGRSRITPKIDDYASKYEQYFVKEKTVEGAQTSFNESLAAEDSARLSYQRLLAVNTATTAPGGTEVGGSVGAEAILRRADAKGGSK